MKVRSFVIITGMLFSCLLSAMGQDNNPCSASFSVLENDGNGGLSVCVNYSIPEIQHYWDFGDGYHVGFGPYTLVSEIYDSTGYYTITHIIRDSLRDGCSDTVSRRIYVYVFRDPCGTRVSASYFTDTSDPQLIHFTPLPDSDAYTYRWDFGDGATSTDREPVHKYSNLLDHYYTIELTVNRPRLRDSCFSYASRRVLVQGSDHCTIDFSYTRNPSRSNEIHFTALDPGGRDSLSWWVAKLPDSNNTIQLSGHAPVHTFRDTGVYDIWLNAIDSLGCQNYAYHRIRIDSVPEAGSGFISTYPNPVSDEIKMDLSLTVNQTIHISIFNAMGTLALTKTISGYAGGNHIVLPTDGFPPGIYYIRLQYGNETRHGKIQKQ